MKDSSGSTTTTSTTIITTHKHNEETITHLFRHILIQGFLGSLGIEEDWLKAEELEMTGEDESISAVVPGTATNQN